MMGFGMGMWGLGALVMILFWVLVIGGTAWLVMTLARGTPSGIPANASHALTMASTTRADSTPLDILKIRYAKGEITKEQFEAMRRELGD